MYLLVEFIYKHGAYLLYFLLDAIEIKSSFPYVAILLRSCCLVLFAGELAMVVFFLIALRFGDLERARLVDLRWGDLERGRLFPAFLGLAVFLFGDFDLDRLVNVLCVICAKITTLIVWIWWHCLIQIFILFLKCEFLIKKLFFLILISEK